jgi:hypothetical protein
MGKIVFQTVANLQNVSKEVLWLSKGKKITYTAAKNVYR